MLDHLCINQLWSYCFLQATWGTKDRKAVWAAMERLVPLELKVFVINSCLDSHQVHGRVIVD
jgi:hypothetical protein